MITEKLLCAVSHETSNYTICHGDSGGPLFVEEINGNLSYVQLGIVSFVSKAGCNARIPVGFTKIKSYLPWILKKAKELRKQSDS